MKKILSGLEILLTEHHLCEINFWIFRLFKTTIEVPQKLEVSWAYKFPRAIQEFALKLTFCGSKDEIFYFILGSPDLPKCTAMKEKGRIQDTFYGHINAEQKLSDWDVR